jgi:hypothetical protein
LSSLESLIRTENFPDQVIGIEYPSSVLQAHEDHRRREKSRARFDAYTSSNTYTIGDRNRIIDPYSFFDYQTYLHKLLSSLPLGTLCILDISCMTKLHTMALAATIVEYSEPLNWIGAYSTPANYNVAPRRYATGWQDTVLAPLIDEAAFHNESDTGSRGLILVGGDSGRLALSLNELEPSGGVVLTCNTPGRPDLYLNAAKQNKRLINHLVQLRRQQWTTLKVKYCRYRGT